MGKQLSKYERTLGCQIKKNFISLMLIKNINFNFQDDIAREMLEVGWVKGKALYCF